MRNEMTSINTCLVKYLLWQPSPADWCFQNPRRLRGFDLKMKLITSDKTLIGKLWRIVAYNVSKSKRGKLLTFFMVFNLFSFVTIENDFSVWQNFWKSMCEITFLWKLSTWLEITLKSLDITSCRGVVLQFFQVVMNPASTGA